MEHKMNVTLPNDLDYRLRTFAAELGVSKAEVIRRALVDYMNRAGWPTVTPKAQGQAPAGEV